MSRRNDAIVEACKDARFVERYWAKVDRRGPDECWPWLGATGVDGYGIVACPNYGPHVASHRVAWVLRHGRISLFVLHKCDNPPCCNPDCLFEGTQVDNIRDMVAKGRQSTSRGEAHHHAKLTADIVREIRACGAHGERQVDIAAAFGLGQTHVSRILRRESWAHV